MAVACVQPLPLYRPRDPQASDLWRLVKVTQTGQVIYKAEKEAYRAIPDPQCDELARAPTEFPPACR